MVNPEIAKLLESAESPYSLVIAIAKRSRDIGIEAVESRIEMEEKPINIADRKSVV